MAGLFDVLSDIYATAFGKSSLKTTMAFNNISTASSLATKKAISGYNGFNLTALNDITLNAGDDAAKRVIKKGERVHAKNSKELSELLAMDNYYSPLKDTDATKFADAIASYKKHTGPNAVLSGSDFQSFIGREGKDGLGAFNTARGYFGDEEFGKARRNVALVGGAGVAVGARVLSGGNLTTNSLGEKDIAGIPFI